MNVFSRNVAGREFLVLEDVASIPMDRIKYLDYKVKNGGATGSSVQIVTDDPSEEWIFAFENCEAIRTFFETR